ncbi:MAG: hypothetical protein ACTHLA_04875 [Asticcacaulis sp.]|uniref:hypothetical protein n=1 Tax=Asticcacaulis sp. TaxID=1872648 RepID=UPI003F7C4777
MNEEFEINDLVISVKKVTPKILRIVGRTGQKYKCETIDKYKKDRETFTFESIDIAKHKRTGPIIPTFK